MTLKDNVKTEIAKHIDPNILPDVDLDEVYANAFMENGFTVYPLRGEGLDVGFVFISDTLVDCCPGYVSRSE